ncbi:hypothetical protein PV327_005143 [Microctonus hyperodae]|nr:hypothetical protein PV327_005143 [Microctonus hyperodae]
MMRSIHKICCRVNYCGNYGRYVRLCCDVLEVYSDTMQLEKVLEKFASTLNKIRIDDNFESYFNFELLGKCTKLTYAGLRCRHIQLLEEFLKFLPLDNLEHLSINYNQKSGDYRWRHRRLLGAVLEKATKLNSLELKFWQILKLSPTDGMKTLKTLILKSGELPQQRFDIMKLQNLEILVIMCTRVNAASITELMRNCRKLHTVQFHSSNIFPETTLNVMRSLPNLRHLHLKTNESSYESWYKFSNLESIEISQPERFSSKRNQIISFLQRSKYLKTYYFTHDSYDRDNGFSELFHQIASDMGRDVQQITNRYYTIPF